MEVNVGLWKIFISLSMWLALFVGWPVCLSSVIFPLLCFWVYVYVCVFFNFLSELYLNIYLRFVFVCENIPNKHKPI